MDEDFYVVPFTSTKESALLSQRQLRVKYPSVRIMTREKFLEALEKESEERSAYWGAAWAQ